MLHDPAQNQLSYFQLLGGGFRFSTLTEMIQGEGPGGSGADAREGMDREIIK